MGKIYLPLLPTSESRHALHTAVSMAKKLGMEVVVISVIDRDLILKLERYKIFVEEESAIFSQSVKSNSLKYSNYAKKLGEEKGVKVSEVVLEGEPLDQTMEYIQKDQEPFKLICIAKKESGDCLKERISDLERKILLCSPFNILVAGEKNETAD